MEEIIENLNFTKSREEALNILKTLPKKDLVNIAKKLKIGLIYKNKNKLIQCIIKSTGEGND